MQGNAVGSGGSGSTTGDGAGAGANVYTVLTPGSVFFFKQPIVAQARDCITGRPLTDARILSYYAKARECIAIFVNASGNCSENGTFCKGIAPH